MSAGAVSRPRVLLVDDKTANLVATAAVLKALELDVVTAQSGNQALQLLLREEFALMLLDLQMPEMNGYEVAQLARSNPRGQEVPIVFLTATHETEDAALQGYQSGAVDFLFKPVNPHILRGKVQAFIDLYSCKKELEREAEAHRKTAVELAEANRTLRHFAHAAAHDLRAPLRAARALMQRASHADEQDDAPTLIARATRTLERMDLLLGSLLAHARLAGPTTWQDVDVAEIVAQVEEDLSAPLRDADARLEASELPRIRADGGRIYQLFLNLVANAIKFHLPGRRPIIRVGHALVDECHQFAVTDNGIGIGKEHAERIFEPFYRLHDASTYQGSGLGLAICHQIVQQHGGTIWVESQPGAGATVRFTLGHAASARPQGGAEA